MQIIYGRSKRQSEPLAVLVSQRDHVWCVVCAEEDGQCESEIFINENLIVVVAEWYLNPAYVNDPYFT